MRPEDFEHFRKLARNMEKLRPSQEEWENMRRYAEHIEKFRPPPEQLESISRHAEWMQKYRLSPEQLESMRRRQEHVRQIMSAPAFQQVQSVARQHFEGRDSAFFAVPNAAMQKTLTDAARYFHSEDYSSKAGAIERATNTARQHLGPEGMAAAERIAVRRAGDDASAERGAALIESGEATDLLEEGARIAALPEVQEAIEQADLGLLLRLDAEQATQEPTVTVPSVPLEPTIGQSVPIRGEHYLGLTRQEVIDMHKGAQFVLIPVGAGFGIAAVVAAAPVIAIPAAVVGGIIAVVRCSEIIVERWEE